MDALENYGSVYYCGFNLFYENTENIQIKFVEEIELMTGLVLITMTRFSNNVLLNIKQKPPDSWNVCFSEVRIEIKNYQDENIQRNTSNWE